MHIYIFDEYGSSLQNGIGTFMRCLTTCLKETAKVTVFSFNDDVHVLTRETERGIRCFRFPRYCNGSFLLNSEPGLAILRQEIKDSTDNIFFINHFDCTRLLTILREYYPMSKLVFVIHDQLWTETLNGDNERLARSSDAAIRHIIETERDMYNLADAVVCLNKDTERQLKDVYRLSPNKIFLIPSGKDIKINPCDKKALRKKLLIDDREKVFLFVGRPTKYKGINDTLIAFEHLAALHPEARLVILGQIIKLQDLTLLCPNSTSRVTFAGLVSQEKLCDWYAAADFGIMSSYYEQFGYAGIEMMAHGLPVVASDAYGTRTMFRDGYNAIVAHIGNRDNPEEYQNNLADAMDKGIKMDEMQYAVMRANARECYKRHYTLANMREGYLRMFENLIDRQGEHQAHSAANIELPMKDRLYHLILHSCDVQDCGLLHGKMGIVLALATFAKQYKQKAIEDYASYLLKRTLHYVHKNMPWSFGKGLCGIVWGIEYLAQNGYVDIDTAEVCEELDRRIMQVSPLRIDDLSLETGLEGLLMYVNTHIANNRNKNVFSTSFLSELQTVALNTQEPHTSLKKQIEIFLSLQNGESPFIDMSLQQFIDPPKGNVINWNNLGLHKGLAGLILSS